MRILVAEIFYFLNMMSAAIPQFGIWETSALFESERMQEGQGRRDVHVLKLV